MPTIFIIGPYRFYFYSHEPNEPPHVHVDKGAVTAKFWLKTIALANNKGYSQKELKKIQEVIIENQKTLLDSWYGYFGAKK